MTKVLLVDDHPLFREGIRALLSAESDIEVVGEASDGKQAIELAQELSPDVIVMDLVMPFDKQQNPFQSLFQGLLGIATVLFSLNHH